MAGTSPSSAGSSSWWVRSVRDGVNGRGEDPIAGGKKLLITKQMNKQKLPRRGKNKLAG